jgi:tRNA(Arg) A34 adenosine deaminase TadA
MLTLQKFPKDQHFRYFEAAYTVALAAPGVGGTTGYRLGAVLVYKKQIIAARYNELRTHPKLLKWYPYPYLHAEAHCILAHGLNNCEHCRLYVMRIRKDKSIAMSRPCQCCRALIEYVGIDQVYYSKDDGYASLK